MLFTNDQRRRILAGEMTATIRAWQTPQVKAGKRYRFGDEHELVVSSVELTESGRLSSGDLAAAGFESRSAFEAALPRFANDRQEGPFYVVRFTLEARQVPPHPVQAEIDRIVARLEKLDRLSDHGPWTRDALDVIATHPRVVSTELARRVGRERFAFKADVRKLKAMGLTRSHDVGYEVTELGRAVLDSLVGTNPAPAEGCDSSISPSPAKSGEGAEG